MKIITYFGTNNFEGIDGVYIIPETAQSISVGAFAGNIKLEYIDFSNNEYITEISDNAFNGCTNLKEVIFGDNIVKIGHRAFAYCTNLKEMIIPNTVHTISNQCFYYSGLETIVLPENDNYIGIYAYTFQNTNITSIVIPNSVEKIENNAFTNCSKLTNIYIGDNLSDISSTAFSNTTSLKTIEISSGNNVFSSYENCIYTGNEISKYTNLVLIPSDISKLVFHDDLESIDTTLPSTLTIDNLQISSKLQALPNLNSLSNIKNVTIDSSNQYIKNIDGVIYSYDETEIITALASVTEVTCEEETTTINSNAFYGNKSLVEIDMSNSNIITINSTAFRECNSLVEITFSEKLEYIGSGCFYNCYNIQNIELPDSLTEIYRDAFTYCSKLTEITIPKNVNTIVNPFSACTSLTNIYVNEENEYFTSEGVILYNIDKTELIGVVYLNDTMQIANTVKTLKEYSLTRLLSSTSISEITLPDGLEKIEQYVFRYSTAITTINISSSIQEINSTAFTEADNLTSINIDKSESSISGAPWGATKGILVVNWN